ncbi:MAG: metallophosphoesterase [Bacteroidetes bacterium]|nr:metallophosphoesterase [Bacteroidota bacterium]
MDKQGELVYGEQVSHLNIVEGEIHDLKSVNLGEIAIGAKVEETFLNFCTRNLEEPEREGKLPMEYSHLTLKEINNILDNLDANDEPMPDSVNDPKELERARLREAAQMIIKGRERTAIIGSVEDVKNPLGEIADATLIFVADDHEAPSWAKEGTRAQAFKRYAAERILTGLKTRENLESHYVDRTNSRFLFDRWITRLITAEQFREDKSDESIPIVFHLGDRVHDGAFLLDQLAVESKYYQMMEEVVAKNPSLNPKILEIDGNHDRDSRIPESTAMLTKLFGHRVFAQEIGGVLMAAVDTNIENPAWVKLFMGRADSEGKKVIEEKIRLQHAIIEMVKNYNGPVVLTGHHPSRLIDAFGVKKDLLQTSNIVAIVGGHTHREDHILTPIKNKNGRSIVLHVLESITRQKDGKLIPPKAFALRINKGRVGQMRTLRQNQKDFDRRFEELMMQF